MTSPPLTTYVEDKLFSRSQQLHKQSYEWFKLSIQEMHLLLKKERLMRSLVDGTDQELLQEYKQHITKTLSAHYSVLRQMGEYLNHFQSQLSNTAVPESSTNNNLEDLAIDSKHINNNNNTSRPALSIILSDVSGPKNEICLSSETEQLLNLLQESANFAQTHLSGDSDRSTVDDIGRNNI